MPSAYLKTLHDEGHGSMEKLEHHWEMAKEQAAKAGRGDDYAYITGILKKSLSIKSYVLATQLVAALREKDLEIGAKLQASARLQATE